MKVIIKTEFGETRHFKRPDPDTGRRIDPTELTIVSTLMLLGFQEVKPKGTLSDQAAQALLTKINSTKETCPLSGAPCDSLRASCGELSHCYLKDGEKE